MSYYIFQARRPNLNDKGVVVDDVMLQTTEPTAPKHSTVLQWTLPNRSVIPTPQYQPTSILLQTHIASMISL